MPTYTARPTTYRGTPMRSRLEATFAAELDREGIPWVYEPRAYASPEGQYLPDFELLDFGKPFFVEVRPNYPGVERAMAQMPIIWESEPTACLVVWTPYGLYSASGSKREWREHLQ